jgi:REP element-mobilizing transposase RayT
MTHTVAASSHRLKKSTEGLPLFDSHPSPGILGHSSPVAYPRVTYDPDKHHRRSVRLRDYDYTQAGAYFVTICTYRRVCLFGDMVNGCMQLNDCGQIVTAHWDDLVNHYPHVELDVFVVMPNHVHGIIVLTDNVGAGLKPAPTTTTRHHGLPEIVRGFKTFSSRRINYLRKMPGQPVWQRNYYEHVIRSEEELDRIRQYILDNPAKWPEDGENPQNV